MPKVSDFKNAKPPKTVLKRRPGRDTMEQNPAEFEKTPNDNTNEGQISMNMSDENSNIKVVDVDKKPETSTSDTITVEATKVAASAETPKEEVFEEIKVNKISIHFPGSDLIRARMSKPFDVAEAIATDWMNDGKFDKIPMGHPLARVAVQQSLRKAKAVEKKIMASPVTEKVAMQAFTYAMKAQGLINEIKSKVKRK